MTAGSGAWLATGLLVGGLAGLVAGWWLLRRRLLVVTVRGDSMTPTYHHGDRLVVRRRRGRTADVATDEVVVADVTGYRLRVRPHGPVALLPDERVVKRVAAVAGEPVPPGVLGCYPRVPPGKLVLLGDNPVGTTDSRHYGLVDTARVVGVVARRLR